jgi:hypothetical protein
MLRIEATIRSDKHIPFSTTASDTGWVSPKAKTYAESVRHVAACVVNRSGCQLDFRRAYFLGTAKLLLWALLKLWLFEP